MQKTICLAVIGLMISLVACNKDSVAPLVDGAARSGASNTAADTSKGRPAPPTPIEISALPATITSAISSSYAGATIERAGKDKDGNYVVLILENNQPKGLLFDASGKFLKVLPPPPPGGPQQGGPQQGGPQQGGPQSGTATPPGSGTGMGPGPRPGPPGSSTAPAPPKLTEIQVSALPAAITDYIKSKYAGAEIKKAGKDDAGNYVVLISQNNQPKGLLFNSAGVFQKELPPPPRQ
ncbi:PepSY-like domain-containing protein [Arsenicibacter rosenii]|uniref:Putative beta-lactamase-inhibitor-like PepSY-like domain-containing protein n=1 Tax=Arsenicibacter rosenii TaxID=1750698 RepID=A0A1S2VLR3_9BACT|nr:PepSY-like domain-containing protein [Arsenicibacter rosenii]OIN59165.1 hypothetical protein BLX24_09200 [Arsenicibacter rosenii]